MNADNASTALIGPATTRIMIPAGNVSLEGELEIPPGARGVVIFAHGCGSSRQSPRDRFISSVIRRAGLGTLLFDMLTLEEEGEDGMSGAMCFDIGFLAERLLDATRWIENRTLGLSIGYFGASTGGSAALMAASEIGDRVAALVSRGCRTDLVDEALPKVQCPTRFIVGGLDGCFARLNGDALAKLGCESELRIIPGATHLFEEEGKLAQVARISANWFGVHLARASTR